jgi:xylulose-5-phosphate/fructose-6-phosphate phosphoketolase
LPPDANPFLSTIAPCFKSKNYVNLMVGSKQPSAIFLSADEAGNHCRAGGSNWKFASTDGGLNPDVVLVGIGSELTFEVIAAADLLKRKVPELRVRVVNVTDLMILGAESTHPQALSNDDFNPVFTEDVLVHFNYHGYANELKALLFGRPNMDRVSIASYMEEGSTTTQFNMTLLNETNRYHIAIKAVQGGAKKNEKVRLRMHELVSEFSHEIVETQKYIVEMKTGTF